MATEIEALEADLAPFGFRILGMCRPENDEVPGAPASASLVLIGNAGSAMWEAFAPERRDESDPLDKWTKRRVDPIAERHGATPLYPFDRPHPPFQRWALRASVAHSSPIGLLIHPEFGLWHAYRAALLVPDDIGFTGEAARPSPCESCSEKPCLSACPVGAFSKDGYDVPGCANYLAGAKGDDCICGGCAARNACPIGREYRYESDHIAFHMTAFARAMDARPRQGPR